MMQNDAKYCIGTPKKEKPYALFQTISNWRIDKPNNK